jgi:hypothetical protein
VKTKRKGTRNERRTMALLEAGWGYYCTRSGGSLGVFDVVGIGSSDIVLVQVNGQAGVRSDSNSGQPFGHWLIFPFLSLILSACERWR